MSVRVRYAPSPTGSPHIGNIRTAIFDWLLVKKYGGQFIARLEDTDRTPGRYFPAGIYDLEASLRFLGMVPDEWWVSGGPVAPYVQSERLAIYHTAVERLLEERTAYKCYCTRERLDAMRAEQQLTKQPTGYDRKCRNLTPQEREALEAEGLTHVVRLAMPLEGTTVLHDEVRGDISYENALQDDQVLLKTDGFPTYFLACAVDDHEMKITHIIRGDDWLGSAPKLVQVFKALGYEMPKIIHPPLIVGADKKKLSKRHGATQFSAFIEEGYLPEAIINFLTLLGWSAGEENRELFTIPELIDRFSLEGISDSPAVFDYDKLKWMNGQYIRASQLGRIIGMCLPYLIKAGLIPAYPKSPLQTGDKEKDAVANKEFEAQQEVYKERVDFAGKAIALEVEKLKTLSEVVGLTDFFFKELSFPEDYEEKGRTKWMTATHLRPLLEQEIARYSALSDWTAPEIEAATRAIGEELSLKFGEVVHPTRLATTGKTTGPSLFDAMQLLGKETVLKRLELLLGQL